jgi:hypothetical protein
MEGLSSLIRSDICLSARFNSCGSTLEQSDVATLRQRAA